jgi:hypothetical protein
LVARKAEVQAQSPEVVVPGKSVLARESPAMAEEQEELLALPLWEQDKWAEPVFRSGRGIRA